MTYNKRKVGQRYIFTSGFVCFEKRPTSIFFESNLEKSFYSLLCFDHAIKNITAQPFTIPWYNKGEKNRYTPDVLVEYMSSENFSEKRQEIGNCSARWY